MCTRTSNSVTAPLLVCVFLVLAALPSIAAAESLRGTVVSIADGDTLTVLDAEKRQHKIRLSGIDAPERKQAFGTRSRQHLADLTFRKQVTADCPKKDRYGRWICKVYVGGSDANIEQLRAGLAWWYRAYAKEQAPRDRAAYEATEVGAREQQRGLWSDPKAVAPWEFRRKRRGS